MARAQQLLPPYSTASEAVRLVSLKFCIDIDKLELAIDACFILDVSDYNELSDTALCNRLDRKVEEGNKIRTVYKINTLVERELCMIMSV